jgi:hypothetical protein
MVTMPQLGMALLLAGAAVVSTVGVPGPASAAPPVPATTDITVTGACAFPVHIEAIGGKDKVIPLPDGSFILVSSAKFVVTNLTTGEQLVQRGGGKGRGEFLPNGDLLVEVSGHNNLIVPGEGIFEVRRATFMLAPPYDVGSQLTILERRGLLIDICARLS